MPYTTYGILHLVGVFGVLLALGSAATLGPQADAAARKRNGLLHGLGMLLLLVSGFGMLAKGQLGFPGWVVVKLVLFLLVGALPMIMRKRNAPGTLTLITLIAVTLAAYLAHSRPF